MIEQITYLLFLKRLDDLQTLEENKAEVCAVHHPGMAADFFGLGNVPAGWLVDCSAEDCMGAVDPPGLKSRGYYREALRADADDCIEILFLVSCRFGRRLIDKQVKAPPRGDVHANLSFSRRMSVMADSGNTVRLHRVLRAPAERVYRAFLDPEAMVKWLPPYGFTGKVHEIDARVGGGYRMSFTNFSTGNSHSFAAKYIELTPHERIRHTDTFDDPNLPGEMQVTISLRKVLCGTELEITQAWIPDVIPVEMCYLGWQESLKQLARVVEPEIPDGA